MLRFLILLAFIVVSFSVVSGHELREEEGSSPIVMPDSISVFFDSELQYSAQDLLAMSLDSAEQQPSSNMSFNFQNSAVWCRFSVENKNPHEIHRLLWINNGDLHTVELYAFSEGELVGVQQTGKSIPLEERAVKHNTAVFDISIASGKRIDYVMKVYKLGGAVVLPFELLEVYEFNYRDRESSDWTMLFFGVSLFALLFNLFLLLILKHSIYLKYTLYVFFSILSIGGLMGYWSVYLWEDLSWLAVRETVLFNFPGTIFLLLFVQDYLNLKQIMPRANKIFNYSCLVLVVGIIPSLMSEEIVGVAVMVSNVTTLYCFVMVIAVCINALKYNRVFASYVLASYVPVGFGVVVFFLRTAGVVKETVVMAGLDIGLALQVLTLAFALVDRFRRGEKEKLEIIKNANEQLSQLSLATRETDNAIAIYAPNGKIEWCNKGFENVYGLPFDEIIEEYGENISEINLNDEIILYFTKCGDLKETVIFETNYQDNSGNQKWMQTTLTPVLDEAGELWHFITVDSDLTELKNKEFEKKQLHNQLLQSQKMETVGKLAGGIAHDFNNVLTPIIGYTEIVYAELHKDSQAKKDLGVVLNAAQRAKKLVKQILTFSRQFKEDAHPLSMGDAVKDVFVLVSSSIPKSIKLSFTNTAKNDVVYADPVQIQQVLMNLCTNAYQAIGENHGRLSVAIENVTLTKKNKVPELHNLAYGEYVHLSVEDTGSGIDEETLKHLFDPFFTTKEVGKGTGLGLSVVHGIVIRSQGEIYFESEKGNGAIAHVYLPVCDNDNDFMDEEASVDTFIPKGNGQRVMIVDDEQNVAFMLERILNDNGFKALAFTSSREAYLTYKNAPESFDVIITDQKMPGMMGDELAKAALAIDENAKVIILTGYSESITFDKVQAFGGKSLLLKPVDVQILIDEILDLF